MCIIQAGKGIDDFSFFLKMQGIIIVALCHIKNNVSMFCTFGAFAATRCRFCFCKSLFCNREIFLKPFVADGCGFLVHELSSTGRCLYTLSQSLKIRAFLWPKVRFCL